MNIGTVRTWAPDGSFTKDGATEDLDPYFMIRVTGSGGFMRPVSSETEAHNSTGLNG